MDENTIKRLLKDFQSGVPPLDFVDFSSGDKPEILSKVESILRTPSSVSNFKREEKAYRFLFYHIFNSDVEIRRLVLSTLEKTPLPSLSVFDIFDFKDHLLSEGSIFRWMKKEMDGSKEKNKLETLSFWNLLIKWMDIRLHEQSSVKVLNSILRIVESGFRSSQNNVRIASFNSWNVLIQNFALNSSVLENGKRLKLLTRPLTARNNAKTSELLESKIKTWWILISHLDGSLGKCMETVFKPFLRFIFGASGIRLSKITFDSFYTLILGKEYSSFSTNLNVSSSFLTPLKSFSLTTSLLLDHYTCLFDSLLRSSQFVNENNECQFLVLYEIYNDSLNKLLTESNAVNATLIHEISSKFKKCSFELLTLLPTKLLVKITRSLIHILSPKEFQELLQSLFQRDCPESELISQILIQSSSSFSSLSHFTFLEKLISYIFNNLRFVPLVQVTIVQTKSLLDKNQNNLEDEDFKSSWIQNCPIIISLLSEPIKQYFGDYSFDFWTSYWSPLYVSFLTTAKMMSSSPQGFEIENVFVSLLFDKIRSKGFSEENRRILSTLVTIMSESLTLSSSCSFESIQPYLCILLEIKNDAIQTPLVNLLSKIPSFSLLRPIYKLLSPRFVKILKDERIESFPILEKILTTLSRLTVNHISKEFLSELSDFWKALLSSHKKPFIRLGQRCWNETFSILPLSDISKDLQELLMSLDSYQNEICPSPLNKALCSRRASPLKVSRSPRTPNSAKRFVEKPCIEDDNSSEFTPIKTKKKDSNNSKRVLTEHQRDILTSRQKDDIPALYSELSRDDSLVELPSIFTSIESSESLLTTETRRSSRRLSSKVEDESKSGTARELKFGSELLISSSQDDSRRKRKRGGAAENKYFGKKSRGSHEKENLLRVQEEENKIPLHDALRQGNVQGLESLPQQQQQTHHQGNGNNIHTVNENESEGIERKCPTLVQLDHGADVNGIQENETGNTPQDLARISQICEIGKMLIENGANSFIKNKDGVSLLEEEPSSQFDNLLTTTNTQEESTVSHVTIPESVILTQNAKDEKLQSISSSIEISSPNKSEFALQKNKGFEGFNEVESSLQGSLSKYKEENDLQDSIDDEESLSKPLQYKDSLLISCPSSKISKGSLSPNDSAESYSTPLLNSDHYSQKHHHQGSPCKKKPFSKSISRLLSSVSIVETESAESLQKEINSENQNQRDKEEEEEVLVSKLMSSSSLKNETETEVSLPRLKEQQTSSPIISHGGIFPSRGAKCLEMSKARNSFESGFSLGKKTPLSPATPPPTSSKKPWERFNPSPSNASPPPSILKRTMSLTSIKRRSVQFTDPPVSEKVLIPPRIDKKKHELFIPIISQNEDEAEDEKDELGTLYPNLKDCEEPIDSLIHSLTNKTWQKTAEKDMKDKKVLTIGDLCRLSRSQANDLKGLKPPNLITLKEALRKFEKFLVKFPSGKTFVVEENRPEPLSTSTLPCLENTNSEREDVSMKESHDASRNEKHEKENQNETTFSVASQAFVDVAEIGVQTCISSTSSVVVSSQTECLSFKDAEMTIIDFPLSLQEKMTLITELVETLDKTSTFTLIRKLLNKIEKY